MSEALIDFDPIVIENGKKRYSDSMLEIFRERLLQFQKEKQTVFDLRKERIQLLREDENRDHHVPEINILVQSQEPLGRLLKKINFGFVRINNKNYGQKADGELFTEEELIKNPLRTF